MGITQKKLKQREDDLLRMNTIQSGMSNAFGPANSFIMGSMIDDIHNLLDEHPINTFDLHYQPETRANDTSFQENYDTVEPLKEL